MNDPKPITECCEKCFDPVECVDHECDCHSRPEGMEAKYRKTLFEICHHSKMGYCIGCGNSPEAHDLMIEQVLVAYKTRIREKVEGMKKEEWDDLPCKTCQKPYGQERNHENTNFNKALDQVLQALEEGEGTKPIVQ